MKLTERRVANFWKRVRKTASCWIWIGPTNPQGYGALGKLKQRAHRVAYFIAHGVIDPKLTIDHLCRNKLCVNPGHLEQVTNRENARRGAVAVIGSRMHCPSGHPLVRSPYRGENRRRCIVCLIRRQRRRNRIRLKWPAAALGKPVSRSWGNGLLVAD